MLFDHLVLAGGGHTNSLMLLRWAMYPDLRPQGLITLVNRNSTTIYSGMIPGLIAGKYKLDETSIDLRRLADQAGVAIVVAEIIGIDIFKNCLFLANRPPIFFDRLSIDVGSETLHGDQHELLIRKGAFVPIKPLEPALSWIAEQESGALSENSEPFTIVGAGFAGVEVALALRQRWPKRRLQIQSLPGQPVPQLKVALLRAGIARVDRGNNLSGQGLLCTGSHGPRWLKDSGLSVDRSGRVLTEDTFQVVDHPELFAVGDCGVIRNNYRPASGVWAVRSATPLARNLERDSQGLSPLPWNPQPKALQLLGGRDHLGRLVAWAFWGGLVVGPHPWLWRLKEAIDRKFMEKFAFVGDITLMSNQQDTNNLCRGCAAKLAAQPLANALQRAGLSLLGDQPEDAALIATSLDGGICLQSVDGFPALVSDPWLNGRLTTLHACSDLWASGANVSSAQAVITLPAVSENIQQELLAQVLHGIQSALEPQEAKLLGGHTIEARVLPPEPYSLGVQVSLTVNGLVRDRSLCWKKGGLQAGDSLLLSRGLGSGVIFASAMGGYVCPKDVDAVLAQMTNSQHYLIKSLQENHQTKSIHACTDITGFGLLGHLGEMLIASNTERAIKGLPSIRVKISAEKIPAFQGAFELFRDGLSSSLAPANRRSLSLLDSVKNDPPLVELELGKICYGSTKHRIVMELIVDPQTCGPLLIACPSKLSSELVQIGPWHQIGEVV